MSAGDLKGFLQVGYDILTSYLDPHTNKIMAQVGNVLAETVDSDQVEHWHHAGFASRAPKPDPKKEAAQGVMLRTGDYDILIASQDMRGLELYALLNFGEACMYAAGENGTAQARVICKGNGSVAIVTTDSNTKDGQTVYFMVAPDGFSFVAPWGTLKFNATGFHVLDSSGANLSIGGIAGMPAPLDVIGSYIKMSAGTINGVATASSFGSGGEQPLAASIPTAAAIASLQTQVTALTTALVAFGAAVGLVGPVHAAAAAVAATAVEAGTTAVSVAAAQMATSTHAST